MSYSAVAIANEFIQRSIAAGTPKAGVTNMKLQKLVYIAHGYSLGLLGRPLINNDIHAFEWGPVIPRLYKSLKEYGGSQIEKPIATDQHISADDVVTLALIDKVWDAYGDFDGLELSRITHKPDTPWSKTWATSKHGIIENDLIRNYYQQLLHERRGIIKATS